MILGSIMQAPHHWPLSQEVHKASGVCTVCIAVRQLHLRGNTVHWQGPRNNPCPGSDKASLDSIPSIMPAITTVSYVTSLLCTTLPVQTLQSSVFTFSSHSRPLNIFYNFPELPVVVPPAIQFVRLWVIHQILFPGDCYWSSAQSYLRAPARVEGSTTLLMLLRNV